MQNKEQVRQDLIAKVEGFAEDFQRLALEMIDKVDKGGAGLLQHHEENGENYVTARQFMAAVAREFSRSVLSGKVDRKAEHNIKQYQNFM